MGCEIDSEELRTARKLAWRITKGQRRWLEPFEICSALEVLAQSGDEKGFKTVVDAYIQHLQKHKLADNPLAYVEWLCRAGDHDNDFIVVGSYSLERRRGLRLVSPPAGDAQKLFQSLYGEHFE